MTNAAAPAAVASFTNRGSGSPIHTHFGATWQIEHKNFATSIDINALKRCECTP
jgi:hypothetical protein